MQLERQIQNKKEEYESLKRSISDLAREEQLYRETLKLIAHESQKYKILLAKSNQLVQSWSLLTRYSIRYYCKNIFNEIHSFFNRSVFNV